MTNLRDQIADMDNDDILDTARELLEAHIAEAAHHGLPLDALHLAALSIGLEGVQAHQGPVEMGKTLAAIGLHLTTIGDVQGRA